MSDWYFEVTRNREATGIWISLDQWDADAGTFLNSLTSALSGAGVSTGGLGERERIQQHMPTQLVVQRQLLSALSKHPSEITIFLDDYHLCKSKQVDEIFNYLLPRFPENIRLVLATREDLGFDFVKLRLQGRCSIQDRDVLRLSQREIGLFLKDFSPDDNFSHEIMQKTEGWPAGLQMAKAWLSSPAGRVKKLERLSGRVENIAQFFSEQVFEKLTQERQNQLIRLALLDKFDAELAGYITGADDSYSLIQELVSTNAFVTAIDEDASWFRMHQLYREFLIGRSQALGKQEISDLHLKAALWYNEHGQSKDAIQHFCEAKAYDLAVEVVARSGGFFLGVREGLMAVKSLIDCFPEEHLQKYPHLEVVGSYIALKEGRNEQARDIVSKLTQQLPNQSDTEDVLLRAEILHMGIYTKAVMNEPVLEEEISEVETCCEEAGQDDYAMKGMVNNLRCAIRYRNNCYPEALDAAQESLKYYKIAGANNAAIFVSIHLSTILISMGRLREALRVLIEVDETIESQYQYELFARGLVHALLAYLYYQRLEFQKSSELLWPAMDYIEAGEGWYEIQALAFQLSAELAAILSRPDEVDEWLKRGEAFSHKRALPSLQRIVGFQRANFQSRGLVQQQDTSHSMPLPDLLTLDWPSRDACYSWTIQRLREETNEKEALDSLEQLILEAENCQRVISLVPFLVLKSLILHDIHNDKESTQAMGKALSLAHRQNYFAPFTRRPDAITKILDKFVRSTGVSSMEESMLEFVVRVQGGATTDLSSPDPAPSTLLTERELQILLGLSKGEANKVIGRKLNLSPNTIKYHLRNLYSKLGTHNRLVAVEVARKRGILESK